jgi:hypothetical protein
MQNALAIISFPLATVESPAFGAESTDQGFALAFEEGVIADEGDTASSDSRAVEPALSSFWIGPAQVIPAVIHPRTEDGGKACRFDAESVAVPGMDPANPDLSQVAAALGVPVQAAEVQSQPSGQDQY